MLNKILAVLFVFSIECAVMWYSIEFIDYMYENYERVNQ